MKVVKIHLDPERDQDLIENWEGYPHREKSKAVKDLWRRGLQAGQSGGANLDMAALRQMLEAVLDSRLAGLAIGSDQGDGVDDKDVLDSLDSGFLVE